MNDVLTAHVSFINSYHAMYLLEKNGTIEEEDKLDTVCLSFKAGKLESPMLIFTGCVLNAPSARGMQGALRFYPKDDNRNMGILVHALGPDC